MTSYERVKAAVEHREADKVPFDLGGSVLTGINKKAYVNLRAYLGLPELEVSIVDEMQQLARPDADFLRKIEVDVFCVDPDGPSKPGLAKKSTRDGEYLRLNDEWGIEWRMPVDNGLYYDMTGHPLASVDSIAALDAYPWPDPADPARFATLKARADKAVFQDKQAYILGRQYAGIWETALWMSGFEKFYTDMMIEKDYAHALMDKITELKMVYWEKALEAVGDNVLIVSEADDLATQNSLLCSPELYKEMVHPYHKKLFDYIQSKAPHKVHIFYHTCGAVKPLIPYLIEEGVDILNPVQVNADGMDSRLLKKEFGKDITFWGGGVDTQHVLPFGTPAEVRDEVKRRIDDFAPNGGFVFAAVHNVQGDVPPENFMAMREALAEFGVY
jgi:uroporphyrinogen decarboxylase